MHTNKAEEGQILYISEQQQQQTIPCTLLVKLEPAKSGPTRSQKPQNKNQTVIPRIPTPLPFALPLPCKHSASLLPRKHSASPLPRKHSASPLPRKYAEYHSSSEDAEILAISKGPNKEICGRFLHTKLNPRTNLFNEHTPN
jgi:hypothetical protein